MLQPRKKLFDIKKVFLKLIVDISNNSKIVFICSVLFFCISFWRIAEIKEITFIQNKFAISLADCFVIMDTTLMKAIVTVPIALVLFTFLTRWDDSFQCILRGKGSSQIWSMRIKNMVGYSLLISFYECLSITIAGLFQTNTSINWNEKNSLFWSNTGKVLSANDVSIMKVIILFFLTDFLINCFTGIVCILSKWLFSNIIFGWILSVGLCFAEEFSSYITIFYKKVSIIYFKWIDPKVLIGCNLYATIFIIFITLIGFLTAKRKEFFYEK